MIKAQLVRESVGKQTDHEKEAQNTQFSSKTAGLF